MSNQEIHFTQFEEDNFVCIPNATIRNRELSWGAKGLLAYLLSHSKDWKIKTSQLYSFYQGECVKGNGQDSVKSFIKELRKLKYIIYKKTRDKNGRWVHHYILFKKPCTDEQFKIIFPEVVKPPLVEPTLVKPPISEDYLTEDYLKIEEDEPACAGADIPIEKSNEEKPMKMIVFRHKTKNVVSKRETDVRKNLLAKGYYESEITTALAEADDCNPELRADNHNVIERYLAAMIDKQRVKNTREKKINDSKQRTQTRPSNNQQDSIQRSRESFREEVARYGVEGQRPGVWSFDG